MKLYQKYLSKNFFHQNQEYCSQERSIMKKLFFAIFFIIQISFQIAEAQWIKQYQNTTSVGLHDVKFINKTTGWACGRRYHS
jgi:hypothetical protein